MPKKKQRADGRYQGKLLVGIVDGKKKYRYVYGRTQKEVNQKLAELKVELGQGVDLTQSRAFDYWCRRWLTVTEKKQTPDWHRVCENRAKFWCDRLGSADVTKINTADLELILIDIGAVNPKTGRPSSKKTLIEYKNVICRIFQFIRSNRVITFDPTEGLHIENDAPKHQRNAITDEQIARIRNTPHDAQLPAMLMLYAGLRLGEACALTWSDIDLNARQITVNKSLHFRDATIKPPKTRAGVRIVPIPQILADYLAQTPHVNLIVCTHNGRGYTVGAWQYVWESYCKKLGFVTSAHCLRHTYCTLLYEAGVDVLSAKEMMGHADISTTMGIYTHLRETSRRRSVIQLDNYLAGSPAEKKEGVI